MAIFKGAGKLRNPFKKCLNKAYKKLAYLTKFLSLCHPPEILSLFQIIA